ncbi:MAG: PKD domain-containing protein [Candidatus Omnitrophica bacterium]|nr:PKD domain-containing protein [Candidatus Omnitrophota bacterium]
MKKIWILMLALAFIAVSGGASYAADALDKGVVVKCNKFTFDGTSSKDPNGDKLTYLWDFGDGTTSTDPVVTHVYAKGGDYKISLMVKDASGLPCDSASTTQMLKVNTPPHAVFNGPDALCLGDTVTYDASGTTDDTPGNLTYKWNFGDGTTGEGKTVTHSYAKGGSYLVSLCVDDNANSECSTSCAQMRVCVNEPPIANAGSNVDLCLPASKEYVVSFSGAQSAGRGLSYSWDFGDGETGTGKNVTHTYKKGGNYVVRLVVDDGQGSKCSTSAATINVKLNKSPIAIAGDSVRACVGTKIQFDGSQSSDPDGDALSYKWDFGDGKSADGAKAEHLYDGAGTFQAILTVNDGKGTQCSSASTTRCITLNAGPCAALTGPEGTVCVGDCLAFNASETCKPAGTRLAYTWDFDGTVVQGGPKMTREFIKGGTYVVRVTVDDQQGTPCSVGTAAVKVKVNAPPIANCGPNLVCCANEQSNFDGSQSSDPDGDALSYKWDFGDGGTAEGAKVQHMYTKGGTYHVVLTVNDNQGTRCSASSCGFTAKVNEQPISVIKIR